jgi:hypothetical protein
MVSARNAPRSPLLTPESTERGMHNANHPELEHHCGSWIAINRATGKAVAEIFERRNIERVNFNKYEIQTAAQWLANLNMRRLKVRKSIGEK